MKWMLITIFLILSGCNNKSKEFINRSYINQGYQEFKNKLTPEIMFSHFPKNIYSPYFIQKNTDDMAISYNYKLYNYDCNINFIARLKESLEKKYISVVDSEISVVKESIDYRDIKDQIIKGKKPVLYFEKQDIPMSLENSNLSDYFSPETLCGLSPDFEIFVIETQSTYNLKDKNEESIFKTLPRTHNEVYSKGISISLKKNCVIYWTLFI
jgi:hypothetical protein